MIERIWLDDERAPPKGWYWVKSVPQAVGILREQKVLYLSLDHDMGVYADGLERLNGYALVKWIRMKDRWPLMGIDIHSLNAVGAESMRAFIERYGPYAKNLGWEFFNA